MAHHLALHALDIPAPVHHVLPTVQIHSVLRGNVPLEVTTTMSRILDDVIQPIPTLSITAAASGLDRLAREHMERNEVPENFLVELWGVLIEAAEQIPSNSPAKDTLPKVVKTLRGHPSHMNVNLRGIPCRIWADLPLLSRSLQVVFDKLPSINRLVPVQSSRFTNLNAFVARLMQDGTIPINGFPLLVLTEALDNIIQTRPVAANEYLIPIAADWIQRAGIVLYKDPTIHSSYQGYGTAVARAGSAAGGLEAVGMKAVGRNRAVWLIACRWRFWRTQFAAASVDQRLTERTRRLAKEAALDMAMISLQHSTGRPLDLGRSHPGPLRRSVPVA